jgi:hypothetical protein
MRLDVIAKTGAWVVLSVSVLGCSTTVDVVPAGCARDDSLNCSQGGVGWSCSAGSNPENEESNLSCSVPQPDGPNDDFCCISWHFTSSTCAPDDSVTSGCVFPSYGYSCAAGDDPHSLDPSLNCSVPTPDGPNDLFCCQ